MYQSLDELTSWRPSTAETAAMNVIMKAQFVCAWEICAKCESAAELYRQCGRWEMSVRVGIE